MSPLHLRLLYRVNMCSFQ